jgi:hypothetical protein
MTEYFVWPGVGDSFVVKRGTPTENGWLDTVEVATFNVAELGTIGFTLAMNAANKLLSGLELTGHSVNWASVDEMTARYEARRNA